MDEAIKVKLDNIERIVSSISQQLVVLDREIYELKYFMTASEQQNVQQQPQQQDKETKEVSNDDTELQW